MLIHPQIRFANSCGCNAAVSMDTNGTVSSFHVDPFSRNGYQVITELLNTMLLVDIQFSFF